MLKPKTILLIDDDEDDRWLFVEALTRSVPAVKCLTASGGNEAIKILSDSSLPLPDMIFLDLNMPGMDGKRCLELLKKDQKLNTIPIVIYSTSNFHRDIDQTTQMGASQFIIKPSDYTQLCAMFRQMFL